MGNAVRLLWVKGTRLSGQGVSLLAAAGAHEQGCIGNEAQDSRTFRFRKAVENVVDGAGVFVWQSRGVYE